MKKRSPFRFDIRLTFTLLVMVEFAVIVMIFWMATDVLSRWFHITMSALLVAGLVLISAVLSAGITMFLSRWFLDPLLKLGEAMSRVAGGDFTTRLETKSGFKEIRDIYANFNLMTQELSNTEILQTDFVSNVSHEFKTPINAIEGYAMLLQGAADATPEERSRYVEKILLNTRRLSHLVGNILLLSKVDNQAIQTKKTTFRLDEQIRQTIVMLEPEWAKKDIEFEVELEDVEYTGNELLLPHVWNNLIGNAVKFDPVGGIVRIRMIRREKAVVVIVEDNGPGISEEARKHIFDRFYQSDSSHKEEGNGLGLALVKQILAVCGGAVMMENIPEGGSRFVVTLRL